MVAFATALAGCEALPRSGPLTMDMRGADRPEDLEGLVVTLTPDVVASVPRPSPPGFPETFLSAAPIDPTRIGVDDVLDITVWEAEGGGLFSVEGGAMTISDVSVDPAGRVFVPFAGLQQAKDATVSELRERIRAALEPLTLSPQVDIRLRNPRSRVV